MIKVGSRVECVEKYACADVGEKGTVIFTTDSLLPYLIEWDNYVQGHDGSGTGKDGHCEWVFEESVKFIKEDGITKSEDRVECINKCDFAESEEGRFIIDIEGSHLEKENKMQDLKIGQVVKTRNGKMWFVLEDRLISKDSWINRKSYDGTKCKDTNFYDIVKIFNAPIEKDMLSWSFSSIGDDSLELVWEEKMFTQDDITIAKLIPKEWKYIARDEDGDLCVYIEKPRRHFETWEGVNVSDITLFNKYFKTISWEDKEPVLISDIIGGK